MFRCGEQKMYGKNIGNAIKMPFRYLEKKRNSSAETIKEKVKEKKHPLATLNIGITTKHNSLASMHG